MPNFFAINPSFQFGYVKTISYICNEGNEKKGSWA